MDGVGRCRGGCAWCVAVYIANARVNVPRLATTDVTAMSSLAGRKYEGSFDPYSMLMAFRRKARAMGVCFIQGEVVGLDADSTDTSEPSEVKGVHGRCCDCCVATPLPQLM